MQSEKLLTSSGKMQAALPAEIRNSGLWPLNNSTVATANLLLKVLLQQQKNQRLLPANLQLQKRLLLKNLNNFQIKEKKKKLKTSLFQKRFFMKKSDLNYSFTAETI